MSLLNCPECGHEVSATAISCPNCGRQINAPAPPVVERRVIVAQTPATSSFPPWAIVPIVLIGLILLFVGYMVFKSSGDQANTNVNLSVAEKRTSAPSRETRTSVPSTDQPSTSGPSQTTTVPGTASSVPNAPPPDKGLVTINAKIAPLRGEPLAARGTKFYLLDKDLESILSEARIEPIEGNSLTASLGLASVFPERYGEFQRAAMKAIAGHVKYSATTSSAGVAGIKEVNPNGYYLFAITRIGRGFALWNSPVSVAVGDNVMNLSPQSVTEIPDPKS